MSDAVVRRATLQDYQGVLEIGIVYDGIDYLPYFYNQYLTDPDYLCYVCEVDGEIAGFQCALLHDGGRVIQGKAGRIKPSHRGKGYLKLMAQRLNYDIERITSAENMMFVRARNTINWETLNPDTLQIDSSIIIEFNMMMPDPSQPSSHITQMEEKHIRAILETPSVCHFLFPRDLMYIHHLPLGLEKANIRHIINDDTRVFATISERQVTNSSKPGNKRVSERFSPESISFLSVGWHYPTHVGQRCSISVFGNHQDNFEAHMLAHLNEIDPTIGLINMAFYIAETFPIEVIKVIFDKYGSGNPDDFRIHPMCTFRNKLDPPKVKSKY